MVLAMMDSSKVGISSTFTYAMPNDVDVVITDGQIDRKSLRVLEDAGVTVL